MDLRRDWVKLVVDDHVVWKCKAQVCQDPKKVPNIVAQEL